MKMITVHLPEKYLEALEDLIREGYFPNRAEAIRVAVRDLLKNETYVFKIKKNSETENRIK